MTQQNALDLIVKNHPQVEKVYDAYQDVFNALKKKTGRGSLMFWKITVVRVRTHSHLHLEEEHDSCS
ncbi:hypothetical protein LRB_1506 [Ligilactobacillus ruminis]|uniref:Uncharacterized protein n=2 Tax=Ligilactobacillus ruminis TaxID=1623 RepID=A0A837IV95_9LACO|nr:hypothetical protein LRB_1506 [Ligilactobacillus ruminis]